MLILKHEFNDSGIGSVKRSTGNYIPIFILVSKRKVPSKREGIIWAFVESQKICVGVNSKVLCELLELIRFCIRAFVVIE